MDDEKLEMQMMMQMKPPGGGLVFEDLRCQADYPSFVKSVSLGLASYGLSSLLDFPQPEDHFMVAPDGSARTDAEANVVYLFDVMKFLIPDTAAVGEGADTNHWAGPQGIKTKVAIQNLGSTT
jgi:hypothetical protein